MKKIKLFHYLFIFAFIFQISMLKFVWGIESISRFVNVIYLLIVLFLLFYSILKKYKIKVWNQYLFAGILIVMGLSINIIISSFSDFLVLAQIGSLIPWILFLLIPYYKQYKKINFDLLWKYAYKTMVALVLLGLFDYYFIFFRGDPGRYLDTIFGDFIGGKFSVLGMLPNGAPYFRFYSLFSEPGTLAMFLLPFITYSFLKKYYLGLLVLLTGLIFTFSLGGYISLLITFCLLYIYKRKKYFVPLIFLSITSFSINYYFSNDVINIYESKGNSASVREKNLSNSIVNFPHLLVNYPLGMPLSNSTSEREENDLYVGSNFIPLNYFQSGGIISLIGYLFILIISVKTAIKTLYFIKDNQNIEVIVVAISMISALPFLFQRTTIWESPIFAFLFAPYILDQIYKKI